MVLKRRLFLFLALSLLCFGVARTEAMVTRNYVRLHVIAADDTDAAQALKLEVRDACLACAQGLLENCESAEDAWSAVNANLEILTAAAQAAAGSEVVRAETGVFDFPDRRYGDCLIPAGRYRAVRMVIGPGEGRNWWCVLYPSLCMPEDYDPEEPVGVYSVIWNWIQSWLGGQSNGE